MPSALADLLAAGCKQLDLTLTEAQTEQLLRYTQELEKWNKTYNLTAVRDSEAMMKRHVLDALSVVKSVEKIHPTTLADIGTGGGIPGVILAVVFPELRVYLVESIGKKCRFLRQVSTVLGLSGRVEVVQQRVEAWHVDSPLSIIICRAFTSLENFTTITRHLGDTQSVWLAMKADNTKAEAEQLPKDFTVVNDETLNVPFEAAERHLLTLKNINLTIE